MRSNNGFYMFRIFHSYSSSKSRARGLEQVKKYDSWNWYSRVEDFDCYHYCWMKRDDAWGTIEYHDVPIWINQLQNLLVVFIQQPQYVPEVLEAVEDKFHYKSSVLQFDRDVINCPVGTNPTLVLDASGEMVVCTSEQLDIYREGLVYSNSLIKSDEERLHLIYSLSGLSIVLCKLFWKSYQLIYGSNRSPKYMES